MPDNFFWYDVMTTDTAAAAKFYCDVVGWQTADSGSPGYTLFTVKGRGFAGLMSLPEDAARMGVPPCWMGYIEVQDVDKTAARIAQEDGTIHKPPMDIPGIIRFSVVADPQGAGFIIAKPIPRGETPPMPAIGTPGTVGWRELYAADWKTVFPFYEKLFGWTKTEAHDMGPMGLYQTFAAGSEPIGGMMTRPPGIPVSYWGYYINVEAIDAAAARVTSGGGQILMGPQEVPGGQWVLQAKDPQGAVFALVATRR